MTVGCFGTSESFFLGGGRGSSRSSSSSSVSRSSWPRFFAVGFVVRPALVVVVGATGVTVGGGLAGRGVRAGKGVRAGAFSLTGVDGWLLLDDNLILILGLPSVGVGGTAGGGIVVTSNAGKPLDGRDDAAVAADAGKYEVGEIVSGSSTNVLGVEASSREAEAEAGAGAFEETEDVLLSLIFTDFLALSILATDVVISKLSSVEASQIASSVRCARGSYVFAPYSTGLLRRSLAMSQPWPDAQAVQASEKVMKVDHTI